MSRRPLAALAVAVAAAALGPAVAAGPAAGAAQQCGVVSFSSAGIAGVVSARNLDCGRAKRLARKCGKRGHRPQGWRARNPDPGTFTLKDGNRRVKVQYVGGTPPGLAECLR